MVAPVLFLHEAGFIGGFGIRYFKKRRYEQTVYPIAFRDQVFSLGFKGPVFVDFSPQGSPQVQFVEGIVGVKKIAGHSSSPKFNIGIIIHRAKVPFKTYFISPFRKVVVVVCRVHGAMHVGSVRGIKPICIKKRRIARGKVGKEGNQLLSFIKNMISLPSFQYLILVVYMIVLS